MVTVFLAVSAPGTCGTETRLVFTRQGLQWLGMSRELFAFPVFRSGVLNAGVFLLSLGCDWNASDALQGRAGQPSINIDEPWFAQSSRAGTSPRGSIMAVRLSEFSVRPFIDETLGQVSSNGILTIICVNRPENVTVLGDAELVQALQSRLNRGVFARVLNVPVAYHSSYVEGVALPYEQLIGTISRRGAGPVCDHDPVCHWGLCRP